MNNQKILTILFHAFIGWALCFAVMGMGMAITSLQNALIIHAAAAPLVFFGVSWVYFTHFNYTRPLTTAAIFIAFVMGMDFFVVALLINRSLEMFTSLLGTWLPFALIFVSTALTGRLVLRKTELRERQ